MITTCPDVDQKSDSIGTTPNRKASRPPASPMKTA